MRISDWSSDVCSSDLAHPHGMMLELFHGPTSAFKDVGARFLAACLRRLPRRDARPLTILVATSGDTGAAVAAAFHRQPGIRVVILYPDGLVSPRQAHQLQIGRAHVCTPVTNAHLVCRLLL